MTVQRTSVTWTVPTALTPPARTVLAQRLGCVFTDENQPRAVMPLAPDVDLLISPRGTQFTMVAHFDEPDDDLPATSYGWLTHQVESVVSAMGLRVGPAQSVHLGP